MSSGACLIANRVDFQTVVCRPVSRGAMSCWDFCAAFRLATPACKSPQLIFLLQFNSNARLNKYLRSHVEFFFHYESVADPVASTTAFSIRTSHLIGAHHNKLLAPRVVDESSATAAKSSCQIDRSRCHDQLWRTLDVHAALLAPVANKFFATN